MRRNDIIRQFRWYLIEQGASAVAFRFLDAVDESVGELLRMPEMGAPKAVRNPALAVRGPKYVVKKGNT